MTHICAKFSVTIKCTKHKIKGTLLTAIAAQHVKKFSSKNHQYSIAVDKSCAKEDENKKKVNTICSAHAKVTL